jgi:ferritin-like metal-binding protein YciE
MRHDAALPKSSAESRQIERRGPGRKRRPLAEGASPAIARRLRAVDLRNRMHRSPLLSTRPQVDLAPEVEKPHSATKWGAQTMTVRTTRELMLEELRDIYHAEKQLVKALPKMAKAAKAAKLRQAFEHHLEETKGQVERLEQVFDKLDARSSGKRCEAMEGLIEEAKEMIEVIKTPEVLDAALIVGAQKVEHYEIASYGSVCALAEALGQRDIKQLLEQTLDEEKSADQKLNKLAISEVNKSALAAAA